MRLIDADALKKDMCSTCDNRERCEDREQVCSEIANIDEQPTIEAEPLKHGRWVPCGDYAKCSICNGSSGRQFDGVEPVPRFTAYCPNCGARMDLKDGDGA